MSSSPTGAKTRGSQHGVSPTPSARAGRFTPLLFRAAATTSSEQHRISAEQAARHVRQTPAEITGVTARTTTSPNRETSRKRLRKRGERRWSCCRYFITPECYALTIVGATETAVGRGVDNGPVGHLGFATKPQSSVLTSHPSPEFSGLPSSGAGLQPTRWQQ